MWSGGEDVATRMARVGYPRRLCDRCLRQVVTIVGRGGWGPRGATDAESSDDDAGRGGTGGTGMGGLHKGNHGGDGLLRGLRDRSVAKGRGSAGCAARGWDLSADGVRAVSASPVKIWARSTTDNARPNQRARRRRPPPPSPPPTPAGARNAAAAGLRVGVVRDEYRVSRGR